MAFERGGNSGKPWNKGKSYQVIPRVEPRPGRMKRCRGKCGEWLPIDCFAHDRQRPDGRRNECRACRKERRDELAAGAPRKERAATRPRSPMEQARERLLPQAPRQEARAVRKQCSRCDLKHLTCEHDALLADPHLDEEVRRKMISNAERISTRWRELSQKRLLEERGVKGFKKMLRQVLR